MKNGIVLQLQSDALDENVNIESLLRKAYVVASKLKLDDFKEWITCEQNGYTDKIPDYRYVKGEIKARNAHGRFIPVVFPSNITDKINTMPIDDPISAVIDLYNSPKNPLYFSLSSQFNEFLKNNTTATIHNFYFETSTSSMHNIISAVRNSLLEWALNLERSGIVGENLSFSDKEIKDAKRVNTINHFTNNFYSSVENTQIDQGK